MPSQALTLTLPDLYPLQRAIVDSTARRKVVNAGRRAGKTQMFAVHAIEAMLRGQKVLLSSTSQDQADIFWQRIKSWSAPIHPYAYKNETKRVLEFAGGRIRVKTGSDADALRGEDADLLILDECARLDPAAWYEVGAPMLADRDGSAVFSSTPNRKNWFYLLYQRAKADETGRYAAWHFSTHANPYISAAAVAELSADMTADMYRQEILAEFLDSGGEVFRNVLECATEQRQQPYAGRFVFGLDWAQRVDSTVIAVLDADTRCMVDMERFNGVSWALQRGRVAALYEKWKPERIYAESNSIGSPNIEALIAEGLPVIPFETTATSKPPLIESLALAFERSELRILEDDVLIGELSAYTRKVSAATGRSQYSAPEGMHDDTVIALALAWHGATSGGIRFLFGDDE